MLAEIENALSGGPLFEVIVVDDGSIDATATELAQGRETCAKLTILRFADRCGQSAAIRSGVIAARGSVIVTLDGDGQNDPADIPRLLASWRAARRSFAAVEMVVGHRETRADGFLRQLSSRIANRVRSRLLHDDTPDSACGLKAFSREAFVALPYFDHMHRFLPALMQREGYEVRVLRVTDRPRRRGTSKYGVRNRLWVGIVDLFGVMWLKRRYKRPKTVREE